MCSLEPYTGFVKFMRTMRSQLTGDVCFLKVEIPADSLQQTLRHLRHSRDFCHCFVKSRNRSRSAAHVIGLDANSTLIGQMNK